MGLSVKELYDKLSELIDGYGFRGYECLITRESTHITHDCPFWNMTIEEINQLTNLKNWSV